MQKDTKRNFALDVLRVLACYMVIQVHTGEFYYIGSVGDVIKGENAFWVDLYNSVCRSAVPLFVMLTGYFLLPVIGVVISMISISGFIINWYRILRYPLNWKE